MSFLLKVKKSYVRYFDGEESLSKGFGGIALLIGLPFAILSQIGDNFNPSAERTAGIGDQQYARLSADVDDFAKRRQMLERAVQDVENMTQLSVVSPEDKDLQQRMKDMQAFERGLRVKLDGDVNAFRTRLLQSKGISEVDAINLVNGVQNRAFYTLWPKDTYVIERMSFLDECQPKADIVMSQTSNKKPYDELVRECQIAETDRQNENRTAISILTGWSAAVSLMVGFNLLGRRFRRQIPEDEARLQFQAQGIEPPQKINQNILVTKAPPRER